MKLKMDYEQVIIKAREKLEGICKLHRICPCEDCIAVVPGLGGVGRAISFKKNSSELAKYTLKTTLIKANFFPDTTIDIFNKKIQFPILPAPMSGINTNLNGRISEEDFIKAILNGSKSAKTLGICGDSNDTTSDYIAPLIIKQNGEGIGVCKPRTNEEILERIKLLKKAKATAIGIDLDGIGGTMLFKNGKVSLKSIKDLKKIRSSFKGPMFLKGILSKKDVEIAHRLGFDGIVISNHGGRVVDYAKAPSKVLPEIAKKYKGKIKILVDGGVKSGYDVFILLALGADAVLIGRSILYGAIGNGEEGVKTVFEKFASELKKAMVFTGCKTIKEINQNKIEKDDDF